MKPRRNLYGIHNDFSAVAGGLRRGCILIRNRDRGGVGGPARPADVTSRLQDGGASLSARSSGFGTLLGSGRGGSQEGKTGDVVYLAPWWVEILKSLVM